MNTSRFPALVLVILLAGAGVSGVLLAEYHGHALGAVARVCGEGSESGCAAVARSPWAAPLGIPLAAAGLLFYLSLALLLGLASAEPVEAQRRAAARLAWLALGAALVLDLGLLALQAFSIRAYCVLCLSTYGLNGAAWALLWPVRRAPLRPLGTRPARLLTVGWGLGSLAWLAAVAALHAALAAGRPSDTALLGMPGSLPEAQERIRTLQATLDDPQKLQSYLAAKALSDFQNAPPQSVDLSSAPVQGDPAAPLRVVTYSDFLCPYCRSLAGGLQQFLPSTAGRVSVRFKHYPLDQECNPYLPRSVHPGACWLARGAVCAQEQGRFQAYHDRVFASELTHPGEAEVRRLAQEVGLDVARLGTCLAAPTTTARLSADIAEARRVGARGTPTVLINGRKLPNLDTFVAALESESARLGLPALGPASPQARPTP